MDHIHYPFLSRPPHTWSEGEHQLAFELHMRAEATEGHKDLIREGKMPLAPGGKGYGGSDRWPMDIHRAIASIGYLRGVINASLAVWANPTWRERASEELQWYVVPAITKRADQANEALEMLRNHERFALIYRKRRPPPEPIPE